MIDSTIPLLSPILLLEDEAFVQQRLVAILSQLGYQPEDIFIASSILEAQSLKDHYQFQMALVDLGLPDGHGSSFIENLSDAQPNICILVISAWSTQNDILKALKAGAIGYLLKERDDLEILFAIKNVLRGGAPIDPFIAKQILMNPELHHLYKTDTPAKSDITISGREKEILELVAKGMSNKEIAIEVDLSRYTVEGHIKNVYRKLSVSTRTQAIHTARDLGLLN